MAFYIKPPGGTEKLQSLAVYSKKRLRFLQQVLRCDGSDEFRRLLTQADTADDSECLIEGTTKDRVSHFLLRLACCQDSEMTSFFVRAETELFCHRFASMNSNELVHLLKSSHQFLLRLCRHHSKSQRLFTGRSGRSGCGPVCNNLLQILQGMLADGMTWEDAVNSYLAESTCRSEVIKVPFEYALSLVASRSVVLQRGIALVPPGDILKVLASLFEELILNGMVDARHAVHDVAASDERMVELFRELKQLYYSGSRVTGVDWTVDSGVILLEDIDNLSGCFPPCMQHLHRTLRKKHRLRHFSRIQYTLFLKEVGLPVSESIKFWRREYSQPNRGHGDSAGCVHTWQRDGRRYTYSIRHLYGLEGSKINYKAHSCRSIQESSIGHGEEGGCPFKHFDDHHLRNVMDNASIASEEDKAHIIDLVKRGKTQAACQALFRKSVARSLARELTSRGRNVKKPRLGSCEDDGVQNVKSERNTAEPSDNPNASGPLSVSASEAKDKGCNRKVDLKKNTSFSSVAKMPSSSKHKVLMHQDRTGSGASENGFQRAQSNLTLLPLSVPSSSLDHSENIPRQHHQVGETAKKVIGSSGDPQAAEIFTGDPSPRRSISSNSHQPIELVSHSELDLTDRGHSSADETQLLTCPSIILRDVQIHKPVDYYNSYIQLITRLQQLEGPTH